MAYNLIQMPCKELHSKEDQFSWRLLVFTINSENKTSAVVGDHFSCDFCVNSQKFPNFLSRKHAILKFIHKKLYIQDLESGRGTFRNNVMLKPNTNYLLSNGDVVAFGAKNEVKLFPGDLVKAEDTPFLFQVLQVRSVRSASAPKHGDSTIIVISDDEDSSPISEEKNADKKVCLNSISAADTNDAGSHDVGTESKSKNVNLPTKEVPAEVLSDSDKHKQFPSAEKKIEPTSNPDTHNQFSTAEKTAFISTNSYHFKKRMFYNQSISKKRKKKQVPLQPRKDRQVEQIIGVNERTFEICSSIACKALSFKSCQNNQPIQTITWVQCDLCDKWFHTACVGCNYDEVKNSNQEFFCEFCRPI